MNTDPAKIKGLISQVAKLTGESDLLKIEVTNLQKEYQQKLNTIKSLRSEINKLEKKQNLKVSEHAIVRYFERIKGFDIKQIEDEILNDGVKKLVDALGGNGTYPNEDYSLVLKNYTVVTITK